METKQPLHLRRAARMAGNLAVVLVLVTASAVPAQESGSAARKTVLKRLAYVDVNDASSVLSLFDLEIRRDRDQNTLILQGSPAQIETALRVLEKLDIPNPSKNLSLTVSILEAKRQGAADLPEALRSVASQIADLLGYEGLALLDTVMVRVSDRTGSRMAGGLPGPDRAESRYELTVGRAEVFPSPDPDIATIIRLQELGFTLYSLDNEGERRLEALISTNVELAEGQTAVVGKATPTGGAEALVLVVRVEILAASGVR